MTAWRDLDADGLVAAREQIGEVLLRSGEAWIVRRADSKPMPTLADIGLDILTADPLRVLALLGREPDRLTLPAFLGRISNTPAAAPLSEALLERGLQVLSGGPTGRALTLLVDAAERLEPAALHFIQFACIISPSLQLVFVAAAEFRQRLQSFAALSARLQPDFIAAGTPQAFVERSPEDLESRLEQKTIERGAEACRVP